MATAEYTDDKLDAGGALQEASQEYDENAQSYGYKDKQSLIQSKKGSSSGIETAPLRDATYHQETIFGFDGIKVIVVSALIFAVAILIALVITILIGDPQIQPHGAVASSNADCSEIGRKILQVKEGSAVDAALAAIICLGVVHGHASGLGGGGFMLIRDYKLDEVIAYDFRETAPSKSNATMFADNPSLAIKGGLAIGVPGELRGIAKAHEQHGKVSWKDLFQYSIDLARTGFKCSGSLANHLAKIPLEDMSDNLKNVYAPGGRKKNEGDTIKRPKLADTLERIAQTRADGVNLFYGGDIGKEIVKAVTDGGGIMVESDLTNYEVKSTITIDIDYQGWQISSLPAPSGGPFVLSGMNIMDGYNINETDERSALYYHRVVETIKFVTAMGSHLGDPAFDNTVLNVTTEMLSEARALEIRNSITDNTHNTSYYYDNSLGEFSLPQSSQGTSHVSVMDNANNMVAVTSTINTAFGSLVMTDSGIILNNEMGDFDWAGKSAQPISQTEVNYISPGKRPQSSMAPVILWKKNNVCLRKMAIGGTNGTRIWTGVTQVLLNLLGFGDSLPDSILAMTRVHHPLLPDELYVEDELDTAIIDNLKERGHNVTKVSEGLSSVNVVMKESDQLYTVSDNRTLGAGSSKF